MPTITISEESKKFLDKYLQHPEYWKNYDDVIETLKRNAEESTRSCMRDLCENGRNYGI